jgi:hypothetical protein
MTPVNESEAFVYQICRRSFLSLWCYNNPKGKGGDELCDILIVCHPHVIIISVKGRLLNNPDDPVEQDRWQRKAIEASLRQVFGAQKWLETATHVVRADRSRGIALPPLGERKLHRIAVAFGGRGEVPISSHNEARGFVHIMTEHDFYLILNELDTVSDVVAYLGAMEEFHFRSGAIISTGTEADVLGVYLSYNRSFPEKADCIFVDDTVWKGLYESPAFKRRKKADEESYAWDRLIELLSDPNTRATFGEAGVKLTELELSLRAMSRENRLARRLLGRGVTDFITQATANVLRSRALRSPSNVIYVLVYFTKGEDEKQRAAELGTRCFIARYKLGFGDTIIGIGLSRYVPGVGSTSDVVYLHVPGWSPQDDEHAERMQDALGHYAKARVQHCNEDEYPPDARKRKARKRKPRSS